MILDFRCRAQSGENESAAEENEDFADDLLAGNDMQCRALDDALLWVGEVLLCRAQPRDGRNASVERCNDDACR
jgi:hypothetical protein